MEDKYPFEWKENTKEDQDFRKNLWTGHNSLAVHTMTSTPMNLNMPIPFIQNGIHKEIWNMKPRSDDIWLVTYPKCGTTMGQELLWQMSRGCNVTSEESKTQLFSRSPFLEIGALKGICECKKCVDAFDNRPPLFKDAVSYAESLHGPRIMKTHLPVSMLPASILDISKVIVIARNPKDACVSFYHHEKLLPNHGMSESAPFDEFAKLYMKGQPSCYGDYWTHLKDSLKWSHSKNLFLFWYEDILANFEKTVNELGVFTGFTVSESQMEVLKEHMRIDNFRNNDAVNMKPQKGSVPDDVRDKRNFIRKGKVGDWKNHFTSKELLEEFDAWIEKNIKGTDSEILDGIKYIGNKYVLKTCIQEDFGIETRLLYLEIDISHKVTNISRYNLFSYLMNLDVGSWKQ